MGTTLQLTVVGEPLCKVIVVPTPVVTSNVSSPLLPKTVTFTRLPLIAAFMSTRSFAPLPKTLPVIVPPPISAPGLVTVTLLVTEPLMASVSPDSANPSDFGVTRRTARAELCLYKDSWSQGVRTKAPGAEVIQARSARKWLTCVQIHSRCVLVFSWVA